MDFIRNWIKEPQMGDARQYRRRIRSLAAIYCGMFSGSVAGISLLVWRGRLFVTLAQRSNVETLTLAFFLVFFAYLASLSARGAWGALKLVGYRVRALWTDRLALERHKVRGRVPRRPENAPVAALSLAIEREGEPGAPFEIPVGDAAGSLGALSIDGARLMHLGALGENSNDLFNYFLAQAREILFHRGAGWELDIVEWKSIDDEETVKYLSLVGFARRLEKHLGAEELWPKVVLSHAEAEELRRRLSEICPALRDLLHLPDWEYEGEHKLPIIPEPLGLISLSRTEKRVDPLASMGGALLVVAVTLALITLMILYPPWVPG